MYAVIETGGKQCRVQEGDVVRVELLEASDGDAVVFDRVLLVGDGDDARVGAPTVDGASVKGTVIRQGKNKKVLVYKFKRRQNSNRRLRGHRQSFTEVKIESIEA